MAILLESESYLFQIKVDSSIRFGLKPFEFVKCKHDCTDYGMM